MVFQEPEPGSLPDVIERRPRRLPARFREQPGGGLPDKLVFGVGMGHGEAVKSALVYFFVKVRNCGFTRCHSDVRERVGSHFLHFQISSSFLSRRGQQI
jgi:hypothetical protein